MPRVTHRMGDWNYQFDTPGDWGGKSWEEMQEYARSKAPFWVQAASQYPDYQGPTQLDPQFQLRSGSMWEQNMLGKQAAESRSAMDRLNSANASNWASARSNMAMRGGLDAGARERMASQAARQGLMGAQEQSRLDQIARLGIGAQAQDRDIDAQKFNIANALNQGQMRNAFNLEKYNQIMQGMAAEKQASVEENKKQGLWGLW